MKTIYFACLLLLLARTARAAQLCLELPLARITEAQEYAQPGMTPQAYVKNIIRERVLSDLMRKAEQAAATARNQSEDTLRGAIQGDFQ